MFNSDDLVFFVAPKSATAGVLSFRKAGSMLPAGSIVLAVLKDGKGLSLMDSDMETSLAGDLQRLIRLAQSNDLRYPDKGETKTATVVSTRLVQRPLRRLSFMEAEVRGICKPGFHRPGRNTDCVYH